MEGNCGGADGGKCGGSEWGEGVLWKGAVVAGGEGGGGVLARAKEVVSAGGSAEGRAGLLPIMPALSARDQQSSS